MGKLVIGIRRFLPLCALLLLLPSLAVAQSVMLQPDHGPVGTGVTANGTGWPPGTGVSIYVESQLIGGPVTSDTSGAFSTTFCIPDRQPGLYPVFFTNGRENFNPPFTITAGTGGNCQSSTALPDLSPTAIQYNPADLVPGKTVLFDSGVQNSGSQGTGAFNIRWFVDGVSLGYGSHADVPANSTVLDGNSQFSWVATAGTHTISFAVDVDNHVLESNESNNSRSVTVTVTSQAGQAPVITLLGDNPLNHIQGCPFIAAGATATDAKDGNLTNSIIITGTEQLNNPGMHTLTYGVTNSQGLSDTQTRQVLVFGTIGTAGCLLDKPGGKAPNLIVYVHGCCTDAADVDTLRKQFSDAYKGKAFLQENGGWEIVVWDWTKCTSDPNVECTPKHDYNKEPWRLKSDGDTAYTYALNTEGKNLADTIVKHSKYKYIHLIAHSSGVNLIDVAAKELKLEYLKMPNKEEMPFIQLTFLDAYTPNDSDKYAYGFLSGYPRHYSEHYVDKTLGGLNPTNVDLLFAFNFDITDWTTDKDDRLFELGHQWPIRWYTRSIESPTRTGDIVGVSPGFTLSLEGGNDKFCELTKRFPPNGKCQLRDAAQAAYCSDIFLTDSCR